MFQSESLNQIVFSKKYSFELLQASAGGWRFSESRNILTGAYNFVINRITRSLKIMLQGKQSYYFSSPFLSFIYCAFSF